MKAVARNKMNIKYAYYKVLETCFGSQSTIKCISSPLHRDMRNFADVCRSLLVLHFCIILLLALI